jgi:hypothetical protein
MVNWFSAGVSSSQQISWPVLAALASAEIFRQTRLFGPDNAVISGISAIALIPKVRAVFGEPRRMGLNPWPSFEARKRRTSG